MLLEYLSADVDVFMWPPLGKKRKTKVFKLFSNGTNEAGFFAPRLTCPGCPDVLHGQNLLPPGPEYYHY